MTTSKSTILAQLQKEMLPFQGLKRVASQAGMDMGLGPINEAFPGSVFPLGAVHEFCCNLREEAVAASGFISGLLSPLMQKGGAVLWISSSRSIFPPALTCYDINPDQVIFIDLKKEKDVLWAMEEALKCEPLAAVVAEVKELAFTASRRLQLCVEQSRVTGFIIHSISRNLNTTACVTRWKITSLPGEITADLPGVGFPRWNVELSKVRNGKPGKWTVSWRDGRFRHYETLPLVMNEEHKKTG